MTILLPLDPPISPTNRVLADASDDFWQPALAALQARMGLPTGPWSRLPGGKNPVFTLGDNLVLKLIPPCWAEDAEREAAALQAHLMARSLLYYGWRYLQRKFPLEGATSWGEVAAVVWPLA